MWSAPAQAGSSRASPARSSRTWRARRVAVGAQSGRGQADQHVPGVHPVGPEHGVALDDADGEAGQIELAGRHGPGVLGHLAAEEGAAGLPASLGHAGHELLHLVGVELARADVVEEEQRLGPHADEVVDAHGHQVDADGVEATGGPGHQRPWSHPVGGGHQHGLAEATRVEGEAARRNRRCRRAPRAGRWRPTMRPDPLDGPSPAAMSTPAAG